MLLALLLLASVAAFTAGCGGDDEPPDEPPAVEEPENEQSPEVPAFEPGASPLELAAIDPSTGAYQGLRPDTREGTEPPDVNGALDEAAAAAGCTLKLGLRDEGNDHLNEGQNPPDYGTNPPTSGAHDPVPLADGSYLETPPERNVVHSLEHGRVAIQYSPSLPKDQQLALKGLFSADPDGMVLFPNPDMPYAVATTAWRNLMGCKKVGDLDALLAAIQAFRSEFRGKGPERIPL